MAGTPCGYNSNIVAKDLQTHADAYEGPFTITHKKRTQPTLREPARGYQGQARLSFASA